MTVINLRRLLIEYKKNKPKEWVEMFALLDYIRDMELTYVCKDSIQQQHMYYDDEDQPVILTCNCVHAVRKKLISKAWRKLKQLYDASTYDWLRFWLRDYLMLPQDWYCNIYNTLT